MRRGAALLASLLKLNLRNRQQVLWSLFFPVLIMAVFGLLGNSGPGAVKVAVVAQGTTGEPLVRSLERSGLFHVKTMNRPEAMRAVRAGTEDAMLVIPPASEGRTATLTVRYNDANPTSGASSVGLLQAFVAQVNVALSGRPPAYRLAARPVLGSRASSYLDFLLPGLLALMAMQTSLFGLTSALVGWKERGILRRFRVTPLRPHEFLVAAVLNALVFGLATAAILVGLGVGVFGAEVALPGLPLLTIVVLGTATFLAIAFVVAGLARSQEATIPIVNFVTFPMMFLSGVFFPITTLPRVLKAIVGVLPLTYLANGVRGLMSGTIPGFGASLDADLLGLLVWLAAAVLVASRTWRWE